MRNRYNRCCCEPVVGCPIQSDYPTSWLDDFADAFDANEYDDYFANTPDNWYTSSGNVCNDVVIPGPHGNTTFSEGDFLSKITAQSGTNFSNVECSITVVSMDITAGDGLRIFRFGQRNVSGGTGFGTIQVSELASGDWLADILGVGGEANPTSIIIGNVDPFGTWTIRRTRGAGQLYTETYFKDSSNLGSIEFNSFGADRFCSSHHYFSSQALATPNTSADVNYTGCFDDFSISYF